LTEQKLRKLLIRLQMSSDDAAVLQGMARQINWKLNRT
jgi:tRNA C32,U32 (ribose-2'-O)-methylase TrmJ